MKLDANDPRLTAYALGELDEAERKRVEQSLHESPDLRRVVEQIRAAGMMVAGALEAEPATSLTPDQRTAIERQSERPAAAPADTVPIPVTKKRTRPWRRRSVNAAVLAASLLIAVTATLVLTGGFFSHQPDAVAQRSGADGTEVTDELSFSPSSTPDDATYHSYRSTPADTGKSVIALDDSESQVFQGHSFGPQGLLPGSGEANPEIPPVLRYDTYAATPGGAVIREQESMLQSLQEIPRPITDRHRLYTNDHSVEFDLDEQNFDFLVRRSPTPDPAIGGGPAQGNENKNAAKLREELTKLNKDLRDAAEKQARAKMRTWRRVNATPNASRLMIGDRTDLPLEGIQANVEVDGFRARVLLDYYYYNDRDRRLEGTFKLRLPNDASLYFFAFGETAHEYRPQDAGEEARPAFFNVQDPRLAGNRPAEILKLRADTWKDPKVARIVPREKAAHAYRETVRRRVDPALVEWNGAGVFSARVFPLMPGKLHRIVVGYDVDLVRVGDVLQYKLDLPEGVRQTAVDVNLASLAGARATVEPDVKPMTANGRVHFHVERPSDRQVVVRIGDAGTSLLAGSDERAGEFFATRFTPPLAGEQAGAATPQAVLLVDTSLSSNPDRMNVWLKLLRSVLDENRDSLRQFAVLFFNVEGHWWQRKFVSNTPQNVEKLIAYAHTLSLEGATDLGQAARQAASPDWFVAGGQVKRWDVFLLSDGAANWGEDSLYRLGKVLTGQRSHAGSLFAYKTGIAGTESGVLDHLARETGGAVFSAVTEAEIKKVARAHRQRSWQIDGVTLAGGRDLLLAGRPRTIYPGQQLTLVGRGTPKSAAPVMLRLRRGDEQKTAEVKIDRVIPSELAARTYGQVAVGQLESLGGLTEDMSVAYARHFRVTGQTCSLLMLETEADYQRFNIKPEDDLFAVKSTPAGDVIDKALAKVDKLLTDSKAAFTAWLARLEKMPGVQFKVSPALKVAIEGLPAEAFDVATRRLECRHRTWEGVPSGLKEQLSTGKVDYDLVQQEAQRRMSKYSEADALRVLSTLVENSPGDLPLARDVAYSAIEWGLDDQAYHLLRRVAAARPYEPQVYLAMAQSLAAAGHADLALLYYEVAHAGTWDGRFRDFQRIVSVDYLHFLRQLQASGQKAHLAEFAAARRDRLAEQVKLDESDLVVTILWNTDATDVDLHIFEPTGEVCFYQHRRTRIGGQLTEDSTQGFGPEMYTLPTGRPGKYDVKVKYYSDDANRTGTRTKVLATIYRDWGRKTEQASRHAVTLTTGKQMHEVATVSVEK